MARALALQRVPNIGFWKAAAPERGIVDGVPNGGSGVHPDPMAGRRRAWSGAAGDQEDTPGGAHLAVLYPGAKGFLDGGERSLARVAVGVPERLADPADPDAGPGDFGYPALTDHHMIGVRRYGDRTESGRI